jgi:chorismate mutase/prephenate dehydratase
MEGLQQYREKIDEIDEKLVALFEERMETVLKVAAYKKEYNLPILDEAREEKVINKNKARLKNKEFEDSLESFFIHLMNLSKKEQEKIF